MAREDLTGRRFTKLVVVTSAADGYRGQARWLCRCDCGQERVVYAMHLKSGNTKACGCLNADRDGPKPRHGHAMAGSKTRTYITWESMLRRCRSVNNKSYRNYGGRGIDVCQSWETFENFLADMGEKPRGLSLDRIDNNRGYAPENCRWATPSQQSANRRTTKLLTIGGETLCVKAWAERFGIPRTTFVRNYVSRGLLPSGGAA